MQSKCLILRISKNKVLMKIIIIYCKNLESIILFIVNRIENIKVHK